jgi:hypothetical protein
MKRDYPSIRAFAKALGIDPSHLSRAMGKHGGAPFDIRGCLRLARLTHEDPGVILRAAGKAEIADLIEELYGKRAAQPLSPEHRQLLDAYRALGSPRRQQSLIVIAKAAAGLPVDDRYAREA